MKQIHISYNHMLEALTKEELIEFKRMLQNIEKYKIEQIKKPLDRLWDKN